VGTDHRSEATNGFSSTCRTSVMDDDHFDDDLFATSTPVRKIRTDAVETPSTPTAHGEWHLCGGFPAAERIAAWAHALQSTGQGGWTKTRNSVSTGRKSIIQKCTSHQGNCQARVFKKCIFGIIFTFSELICILFFTTQMKRSMDLKTVEVQLFLTGVAHNLEAARPPRGIHQPYNEQVNRLLETGRTAADIPAKIALESSKPPGDAGAAPVPHYDRLRTTAAAWGKNLPQYNSVHELECALAGYLVETDDDWLTENTEQIGGIGVERHNLGLYSSAALSRAVPGR
jgi:hypothetical protein